ncbi:MAG TPA: hypothetical protein EYP60_00840 [bacterium (Candidatus Stahlbacteria)]|nr:hypothetical protein [Candidatus Stahlbacteria bacterium]
MSFSIAMAFVEAAVVVYLRQLYYPGGFAFPLRQIPQNILTVELGREFVPWVAPVLAPILVALAMTVIGTIAIYKIGKGTILEVSKFDWLLAFVAALSIFISFVWDFPRMTKQELPSPYHWEFLMLGEFMIFGAFFHILKQARQKS